jgi:hypothetical protein
MFPFFTQCLFYGVGRILSIRAIFTLLGNHIDVLPGGAGKTPPAIFAAEVSTLAFQARREVRMQHLVRCLISIVVPGGTQCASRIAAEAKLASATNVALYLASLVLVLSGWALITTVARRPIRTHWAWPCWCRAWHKRGRRRRM